MYRFITLVAPLFVWGVAHAAEIADAPIPDDNIVGIIIFLALMVGGGVWFAWKIMRNDKKSPGEQDKK